MAAAGSAETTHPPVALRAVDGRNDRRHESRRNGRRFGTRDRRRGDRRKHALRSLMLAAATMSASPLAAKSPSRNSLPGLPELSPRVSVEMSNFIPIRPEVAYEDLIQEAAQLYDLDPALIRAVMRTESAFNAGAVSPVGAMGLMQLMPELAEEMGVADPFDPRDNIMGGAKYLKQLLDAHKGQIDLTLASYNAGPGNVKRYRGIPPFKETRDYVKKITELLDTSD
jgi:soluble lytic murein transglycosylase-like protein